MSRESFPASGSRVDDPMLSSRVPSSDDHDSEDERFGPTPVARRPRGTRWCLSMAFFCCTSLFLLTGLMLSPFFIDPPARPVDTQVPDPDSSKVVNAATPAEQLDLKTNFAVSSVPATRDYVFNITVGSAAPDGFLKPMILVNGQSPGPLIEANTGDRLRIVVNNQMPEESTTIHWHGINQWHSNWMDGVHGVTQCGIPPGRSFTYDFNVTGQRGTFWYHSHVSTQYTNGLYGPIVIHDPDEKVPPTQDDKIIMVGDMFRNDSEKLLSAYLGTSPPWGGMMPGTEPSPDNILINGHHVSNCTSSPSSSSSSSIPSPPKNCTAGTLYTTRLKSNTTTRLRLISHSTSTPLYLTLDSHILQIVEIDGTEIEPIPTTRIFINPGQRYSVLVSATQPPGTYLLRVTAARRCFHMGATTKTWEDIEGEAVGVVAYDDFDFDGGLDSVGGRPWDLMAEESDGVGKEPWESPCWDLPFGLARPVRREGAWEVGGGNLHYFEFSRGDLNGTVSFINETVRKPLMDDAMLWRMPKLADENQMVLVSQNTTAGAQIVINSNAMMMHPFHLHANHVDSGQSFQVVGWGPGMYGANKDMVTTWNLDNPLRRDTVTVPGYSHVIIRIPAQNPGVWALHCHILWHAEDGMFVLVAQQLDKLQEQLKAMDEGKSVGDMIAGRFCTGNS
ncbi:multicopper oxidase-domain-containing protein [Echria macrotheca]|uniref:Multicopper oxidase-domain-containing protein n=1 Tax=Echria macrotheca TaxID=438768 RepID=A0AAJ0B6I8_9PEZI|nr:multicopper oxidase-domain-containing protein [Echria macrotheca]